MIASVQEIARRYTECWKLIANWAGEGYSLDFENTGFS